MDAPASRRFALLPSTRYLVPVALGLALAGVVLAPAATRLVYVALTAAVVLLWLVTLLRRPVLIVDDGGYRVEIRRREILRVAFAEVKRVRAVPAEDAMYVDCGDPARNLLLPGRSGFGFRFARQAELYAFLALRLADRIELTDRLVPDRPVKNGHNRPTA